MGIFFGFYSYLCAKSGERSFTLQKSAENFTARQEVKKSQFRSKNWRNFPSAVETKNKLNL